MATALCELAVELGEPEPGVTGQQVSRWERGIRRPSRYYRPRLCIVFEELPKRLGFEPTPTLMRDIGELGRRRVERRHDQSAAGSKDSPGVMHEPGGSLLPESAFQGVDRERLATALRYLWPADRALVAGLARAERHLSYRRDTEAPASVLPDLHAYVAAITTLLSRSQPPDLAVQLRRLASTAAQHAGFLADVDDHWRDAYERFAVAESLARESGSGTQLAQVLVDKAEVVRRHTRGPEELGPSTALARAADLVVEADAPAGLTAWIAGELAAQEAVLGNEAASARQIERAGRIEAAATPEEMNIWAPNLDSGWLDYYRGSRALYLKLGDDAVEVYERVLARTDPRLVWERIRALGEMASACLLKGEVERACYLLSQAVDLATATGDQRGLALVRRVSERQLGHWRTDPHVSELDDAIQTALRSGQ